MPKYKFYYFALRGIGEASRMVLNYANVEFEDIRVSQEEWPKLKKKMPQGTMPVLIVDGNKKLSQSSAVALYLARKYGKGEPMIYLTPLLGLAGRNEWEMARVHEVIDTFKDMYSKMSGWSYVALGFQEGDKDKLHETVAKPAAEKFLPLFVNMLQKHHNNFIASEKPTVADFFVAEYLFSIHGLSPGLFKGHEVLLDYIKRVHAIPQLEPYLRIRPKTNW